MATDPSIPATIGHAWRQHWPYFKLSVAVFVFGTVVGVAIVGQVDLFAILGFDDLGDVFPDEITTMVILVNNSVVFVLALLGVFSFGLLTVLILLFNGILVGYVAAPVASEAGLDFVFVALFPHGILELPAFFIASAIAFRLLHRFALRVTNKRETFLDEGDGRRIAVLAIVGWVILAVAAVVEVHVTFWLIEQLFPEVAQNAG